MLNSITYYRFMTSWYAYSAIGSGLFTIIFAIIAIATRFRQKILVLSTLGMLFDAFIASLASYVSGWFLEVVERTPDGLDGALFMYGNFGFLLSIYACGRVAILDDWNKNHYEQSKKSSIEGTCYIANFLSSGTLALIMFVHCIVFAVWLIWKISLFLWFFVKWPLEYVINGHKSTNVMRKVVTNTTPVGVIAINATKMMDILNATAY